MDSVSKRGLENMLPEIERETGIRFEFDTISCGHGADCPKQVMKKSDGKSVFERFCCGWFDLSETAKTSYFLL